MNSSSSFPLAQAPSGPSPNLCAPTRPGCSFPLPALPRASEASEAESEPSDYDRGWADASAEMARQYAEQRDGERQAMAAIELSISRFNESAEAALRDRLRDTVLALCEAAMLPMTLDPAFLAKRIDRALDMLRDADERRLCLHPDDLALVSDRLPDVISIGVDPALQRGELRIESALGDVEDGPALWRDALHKAFSGC